jgi:5'-methylthioadenosine phosphorylase
LKDIKIAIIGGTGVYQLPGVVNLEKLTVETPYGKTLLKTGELGDKKVAFLTRHGENHSISPGQINYRANIWALKELGVRYTFATACSGSLNPDFQPGDFVMLDQFLEFTKNRPASFYYNDGSDDKKIAHVDLTYPYCNVLTKLVIEAGKKIGIHVKKGATYCCVEGPRFESYAEIQMLQKMGGDLVAQTNYPEVALAREAEMCYAAIGIVANMGAGIGGKTVTATEVKVNMQDKFEKIQALLSEAVRLVDVSKECTCHYALKESQL